MVHSWASIGSLQANLVSYPLVTRGRSILDEWVTNEHFIFLSVVLGTFPWATQVDHEHPIGNP